MKYEIITEDNWLVVIKDGIPLLTPGGEKVYVPNRNFGKKLINDLEKYGDIASDPVSLFAFYSVYIDFFFSISPSVVSYNLGRYLSEDAEWTFNYRNSNEEKRKIELFGSGSDQIHSASRWLIMLTRLQLCAVGVISKAIDSVNTQYIYFDPANNFDKDAFFNSIIEFNPYIKKENLIKYFKNGEYLFSLDKYDDEVISNKMKSKYSKSTFQNDSIFANYCCDPVAIFEHL